MHRTAIRPVLMYGSSTRIVVKTAEGKLDATERFLRHILGYKSIDKIRNTELYDEVRGTIYNAEVSRLLDIVRKERLKLLGHIMRQSDERLVKMVLIDEPVPTWTRPRGWSSRTWKDLIKADSTSLGFDSVVQEATKIYGRRVANTWRSKNWLCVVGILADDRDLWKEMCRHHGRVRESEAGSKHPG
ncbi:hypothetical protein AB6A40_006190 [Gnathostoma spinigerum]|uniref:Uncharacterized protein n=1 Tax=Gnathostoma spinigerum TaxID=75299 RepID=A0ABD6EPX4_9BILA